MKKESLTNEIEWFCHHAVTERLLTKEACVSVIEAIEENGLKVSLDLGSYTCYAQGRNEIDEAICFLRDHGDPVL